MAEREATTTKRLTEELRVLGIERGGVLIVHTSFRSVGPIAGGPTTLIDALRDALGPTGTLVMPSMSGSRREAPYDPAVTPTRGMGVVAESFWRMPGILRGDHPTSSFAAAGPHAEEITAAQPLSPGHGLDSPIGRVYRLEGSILLLGIGHDANTTIHLAEALARVPYRIRKWATVLRHGEPLRVEFDATEHCCRNFDLVDGWLRESGLQAEGAVGHANARLMRSSDLIKSVVPRLERDPLCFLCDAEAACEDCDAARRSTEPQSSASSPNR